MDNKQPYTHSSSNQKWQSMYLLQYEIFTNYGGPFRLCLINQMMNVLCEHCWAKHPWSGRVFGFNGSNHACKTRSCILVFPFQSYTTVSRLWDLVKWRCRSHANIVRSNGMHISPGTPFLYIN